MKEEKKGTRRRGLTGPTHINLVSAIIQSVMSVQQNGEREKGRVKV